MHLLNDKYVYLVSAMDNNQMESYFFKCRRLGRKVPMGTKLCVVNNRILFPRIHAQPLL